jgi:hypothetical protein
MITIIGIGLWPKVLNLAFLFFQPFNKIINNHGPRFTGIIVLKIWKTYLPKKKHKLFEKYLKAPS